MEEIYSKPLVCILIVSYSSSIVLGWVIVTLMKTSSPSPIRGILWLQLLGWGTKGEIHVSLEEYDTPLHTDCPVFVVNFEQVSYLILLHVFLKVFLKCQSGLSMLMQMKNLSSRNATHKWNDEHIALSLP